MTEFFETYGIWVILGGILLLALLVAAAVLFWHSRKIRKLGLEGERKVARILGRYAGIRSFKVINDLYLPLYDKTTQIDHILIGFFGILVIETKNHGGEIYGDARQKEWTQIIGSKKNPLYNPLMQNQAHIDCIRHILGTENLYNVPMESLIVFTKRKVELFVPKKLPILKVNRLKKFLRQPRFQEDKGFDVEKHYQALLKHRVTDPKLLNAHNRNVQIMAQQNKM